MLCSIVHNVPDVKNYLITVSLTWYTPDLAMGGNIWLEQPPRKIYNIMSNLNRLDQIKNARVVYFTATRQSSTIGNNSSTTKHLKRYSISQCNGILPLDETTAKVCRSEPATFLLRRNSHIDQSVHVPHTAKCARKIFVFFLNSSYLAF